MTERDSAPVQYNLAEGTTSPMRSSAVLALPRTSMVTSAPRFLKILAYSMAMMPEPTMVTLLGRKDMPLMLLWYVWCMVRGAFKG